MIRLDLPTKLLKFKLEGLVDVAQVQAVVSYSDQNLLANTYDGTTEFASSSNADEVILCSAPPAGSLRDVDTINLYNGDSSPVTVTVWVEG